MAENVVEILIKSTNDTKEGFDSAKADAEVAGDEAGQSYMDRFSKSIHENAGGGILSSLMSVMSFAPESIGGAPLGAAAAVAVGVLAQGLTTAAVAGLGLGAALAPIAGPIMTKITGEWDKWSASIQKTAGAKAAIGAAGSAFGDLLNAMTPLVMTMMPDLERVFADIGKSATSGGIKTFFTWMAANAPKAFNAVASAGRDFVGAIHVMQPVISAIADSFKTFFHLLDAGFDLIGGIIDLFTGNWTAAGNKFKAVGGNIEDAVHDMVAQVETLLGAVISYFAALPGKIVGALGDLGGRLFSWGAHIISQLADGILSEVGSVTSAIGRVAGEIVDHIPHSPAKKGPLSGSGDPRLGGRMISQMLADGMQSGIGPVGLAASSMAGAARGGIGGAGRGGVAGGGITIQLGGAGSSGLEGMFWNWLQHEVRVRGGGGGNSVQRALGQTA